LTLGPLAPARTARLVGTGDPTVVLSELPGGRSEWGRTVTGLSRSLRILIFEPTASPDEEASGWGGHPDRFEATELVGILEQLGHWPAHLIGVGRAGGRALELARQRPELVRGLVLHEPDGPGATLRIGAVGTPGDGPSAGGFFSGFAGRPLPGSGPEVEAADPGAFAAGDLEQPVLVTAGSESPLSRRESARRLSAQLPNARWLLLPGVAGEPHQESPDLFVAVVTEFLTVRSVPPA